jgi:hypothetical protein
MFPLFPGGWPYSRDRMRPHRCVSSPTRRLTFRHTSLSSSSMSTVFTLYLSNKMLKNHVKNYINCSQHTWMGASLKTPRFTFWHASLSSSTMTTTSSHSSANKSPKNHTKFHFYPYVYIWMGTVSKKPHFTFRHASHRRRRWARRHMSVVCTLAWPWP